MNRTVSPTEFKKTRTANTLVLDVRRKSDYETDGHKIPGAAWLDPDKIGQWSTALPLDREIVVYCVRGGSVSNTVVDQLQAKGIKARYIEGGIEAWKQAGGEIVSR